MLLPTWMRAQLTPRSFQAGKRNNNPIVFMDIAINQKQVGRITLELRADLIILGLDQLRKFKCIVDLERSVLIFGGAGGVEVSFVTPSNNQAWQQSWSRRGELGLDCTVS